MTIHANNYKEYLENYLRPLINSSDIMGLKSLYDSDPQYFHETLPSLRKNDQVSFTEILTEQELITLIRLGQQSDGSIYAVLLLGGLYTRDVINLIYKDKIEILKEILDCFSVFDSFIREYSDTCPYRITCLKTAKKYLQVIFQWYSKQQDSVKKHDNLANLLELVSPDVIEKIDITNIIDLDILRKFLYYRDNLLHTEGYQTIKALTLHPEVKKHILMETNLEGLKKYRLVIYYIFRNITEKEFVEVSRIYLKNSSKLRTALLLYYPEIHHYPDIQAKALTALFSLDISYIELVLSCKHYGFKLSIPDTTIEKLNPKICFTILDRVFQDTTIKPELIVTDYKKLLDKASIFALTSPDIVEDLSKIQSAVNSYQDGFTTLELVQRFTRLVFEQPENIKLKIIQKILDTSAPEDTKYQLIQLIFDKFGYYKSYSQAEEQFGSIRKLLVELNSYISKQEEK
jgi:hypothetical protein